MDGRVAQFLFRLQAQVQRLRRMALGLRLRQRDGFAFLLQVGQRARLFQRAHFGGGAVEGRFQRDLVGALALHRQFQRFAFRFGQHLRRLARAVGVALAFARQHGDTGVGRGDAHHFLLGRLHGGDALDGLQARLLRLHLQFLGGAGRLFRQFRLHRHLFAGAQAAFLLGAGARLGGQADFIVRFHAGAQFGRLLLDRFQAGHAGLRGGAHGFQALAVGGDGFLGRLRVLLRGGGGGRIDGGAVLCQRAHARFGQGTALCGAGGFRFRFHAGDRLVDGLQFHFLAFGGGRLDVGFLLRLGRSLRLGGGDRRRRLGLALQVLEIMQRNDAVLVELVVGRIGDGEGNGLALILLCLHDFSLIRVNFCCLWGYYHHYRTGMHKSARQEEGRLPPFSHV